VKITASHEFPFILAVAPKAYKYGGGNFLVKEVIKNISVEATQIS